MATFTAICVICGQTKLRSDFVRYTRECLACRAIAKTCTRCGERKPLTEFYVNGRGHDARVHHCKPCVLAVTKPRDRQKQQRYDEARKKARNERLRLRRLSDPAWAEQVRAKGRLRRSRHIEHLLEKAGGICYLCRDHMTRTQRLEVDHIVPVSLGGTNTPGNEAAVHRVCNRRKGATHPMDLAWLPPESLPLVFDAVAGLQSSVSSRKDA